MSSMKERKDQMSVDNSQAQGICMSSGGALEGQQCLCVNACVCVSAHMHTRVCAHVSACMSIHTRVYVHTCVYASVGVCVCVRVCTCVHACGLEGGRRPTEEGHSGPSLSPCPQPLPFCTLSLVFCVNCT